MLWPTKKLGEVLEYEQPTKYLVSSTDYKDEYLIPVLTAGKSFILGNTNEKSGIFPKEKLPVIIFDDFTTAIKFVDFPFKVKSSAMKILHAKKDKADIRFLFYKMLTIKFQHDQHKRYWISECSNLKIPLPPFEIQKQIVERLDKIAEARKLNDELIQKTDELFQSLLHSLIRANSGMVKKLGEIAEIIMGQSPPSSTYNERGEGLPFFQGKAEFGEMYPTAVKYCSRPTRIAEAGDILMSVRAPVGNINLAKEKSGIGRGLGAIRAGKGVDQLFLYFFFLKNENNWSRLSVGSTFLAIRRNNLDNLEIPLPPLQTQKQIVSKLSAVQDYKTQLLAQKSKLKELFDSALHKSMQN